MYSIKKPNFHFTLHKWVWNTLYLAYIGLEYSLPGIYCHYLTLNMMYQVDYTHIKAWLTIQELEMSTEAILSANQHNEDDSNGTEELSDRPNSINQEPCEKTEVVLIDDSQRKRQKVDIPEQDNRPLEVTEASLLDWLQNFENGVSIKLDALRGIWMCVQNFLL